MMQKILLTSLTLALLSSNNSFGVGFSYRTTQIGTALSGAVLAGGSAYYHRKDLIGEDLDKLGYDKSELVLHQQEKSNKHLKALGKTAGTTLVGTAAIFTALKSRNASSLLRNLEQCCRSRDGELLKIARNESNASAIELLKEHYSNKSFPLISALQDYKKLYSQSKLIIDKAHGLSTIADITDEQLSVAKNMLQECDENYFHEIEGIIDIIRKDPGYLQTLQDPSFIKQENAAITMRFLTFLSVLCVASATLDGLGVLGTDCDSE